MLLHRFLLLKGSSELRAHSASLGIAFGTALGIALAAGLAATPLAAEDTLRVTGSTTVNPVVAAMAEVLRSERGLDITVDTLGGSSGGIHALGSGRAEVAMSSRPITDRDREKYPNADFRPVRIAVDALALVVSRDVWEGGVRSLSREEVRRLYEGDIDNWSDLGGPDQRVVFFNKEPGRGTWEVFAEWLYSDADQAPRVRLPEVGSNEEARSKVGSTRGAITQLSAAWADGKSTFAVALETEDGNIQPTEVTSHRYPLARSLFIATNGPPNAAASQLIELLLSPRGQQAATKAGYTPVASGGQEAQSLAAETSSPTTANG